MRERKFRGQPFLRNVRGEIGVAAAGGGDRADANYDAANIRHCFDRCTFVCRTCCSIGDSAGSSTGSAASGRFTGNQRAIVFGIE
jgi:hypothetical protein